MGRGGHPDQARHRGAGPGHGGRQRREGQQPGGAQVSPGQDPGGEVRILGSSHTIAFLILTILTHFIDFS